jgi:hypothetical protein
MTRYVEIPWNQKLALLRQHDFSGLEWKRLDDVAWCLHCNGKFTGHQARVWRDDAGRLWLECGTPKCHGSPIDWASFPWWDPKHRVRRKRGRKPPKGGGRRKEKPGSDDDIPF